MMKLIEKRLDEIILLNDNILPEAVKKQVKIKETQAANYDREKKSKPRAFRIGDQVLIVNHTLGDVEKIYLESSWIGPYRVEKKLPNNVYMVSDGHLLVVSLIHVNDMKLYLNRPKDNYVYRKWVMKGEKQKVGTSEDSNIEIQTYEDDSSSNSFILKKRRRA
ncbi:hypothetical protein BD770DRAFT_55738 [Pilaira anomala]|nr:hypothetical protein BD770DRAFT_55738 [Pilaira anomala]